MIIEFSDFLNEKMGIPKPVEDFAEIIFEKYKTRKNKDSFLFTVEKKHLIPPFNSLRNVTIGVGEKYFKDKPKDKYGESTVLFYKNSGGVFQTGLILIRNEEYLYNGSLHHELTHLYQEIKRKLIPPTQKYNFSTKVTIPKESEDKYTYYYYMNRIQELLYFTSMEEMSARLSETFADLDGYYKEDFTKLLEYDYNYEVYSDFLKDNDQWLNHLLEDKEMLDKVCKQLKEDLKKYKINPISFLKKLDKESKENCKKFLRKVHKLYDYMNDPDYVKDNRFWDIKKEPRPKKSFTQNINDFIKNYITK